MRRGLRTRMQPWLKARLASSNRAFVGRVVHVDVVLVGEAEFNTPSTLLPPGG